MAIIKVNFDKKGTDFIDNYIPLVREALDKLESDTFSLDQFKIKFIEIAEFKIPTGAILSLLKRSENKYKLLERQPKGEYRINRENINNNYLATRDAEQRKYNRLINKFIEYCKNDLNIKIETDKASVYFFEVLYDISPSLFFNISDIDTIKDKPSENNKFLVAKFVDYSNKSDHESFEAILSFVRGSMLTETFYYSQNISDITNKPLKRVTVYFDTQFLIRVLGFSDESICIPCKELNEMLGEMQIGMRCFKKTFDELHGILLAALNQLTTFGRLNPNRPGDVFDYFNRKGTTQSDLLVILQNLEEKLNKSKIYLEDMPSIIEAFSINENSLKSAITDAFEFQSDKARNHDIDCLQAVHQIREGRPQNSLEGCRAIFITTNTRLARLSTLYFNDNFGISNAPVCMADNVFTSLVWMKSVKKTPDIPKDRLVANCYSALLPSESLWSDYIKEVNKLKDDGTINENDYNVLIYSITAREHLMDQAFSSDDNIFGSVQDILEKAKHAYTIELSNKLTEAERYSALQVNRIENITSSVNTITRRLVFFTLVLSWVIVLLYSLIFTSPTSLTDLTSLGIKSILFIILIIATLLNIMFGVRLVDHCRSFANKIGESVATKIKNYLTTT